MNFLIIFFFYEKSHFFSLFFFGWWCFSFITNDVIYNTVYGNDINNIEVIIEKGLTNEVKNQQKKLKEEIFYLPEDLSNDFLRVINKYLNDEISLKYIITFCVLLWLLYNHTLPFNTFIPVI